MTATVWYIGDSDVRVITAQGWLAAGIPGVTDVVWNSGNDWAVPTNQFNTDQLLLMDGMREFNISANGPRPADFRHEPGSREYATVGYVDSEVARLEDQQQSGLPSLIDCGGPADTSGA